MAHRAVDGVEEGAVEAVLLDVRTSCRRALRELAALRRRLAGGRLVAEKSSLICASIVSCSASSSARKGAPASDEGAASAGGGGAIGRRTSGFRGEGDGGGKSSFGRAGRRKRTASCPRATSTPSRCRCCQRG